MSAQQKLQIGNLTADDLIKQFGSPLYVYDAEVIKSQYQSLVGSIDYPNLKIHYASKANTNPAILKLLRELGSSVETVSRGEVEIALGAGFKPEEIIFTCSNISEEEIKFLIDLGIAMNLDSLEQINKYGRLNPGSKISLRINKDVGVGDHNHFITGGPNSKFGIHYSQLEQAGQLATEYDLKITGIHQHVGSSILQPEAFMVAMDALLETALKFEELEVIDFGGGFGVPYRPEQKPLDVQKLGKLISKKFTDFCNQYGSKPILRLEPGRFLVAESGTLLATVTDIKQTPTKKFVGLDTGMGHLVRPAMYGAYHHIVNASDLQADPELVTVVGNICESGDEFGSDRTIAKFAEGDIAAIQTAGAYGYCMASNYNSRLKPAEVLVSAGKAELIRERE